VSLISIIKQKIYIFIKFVLIQKIPTPHLKTWIKTIQFAKTTTLTFTSKVRTGTFFLLIF
jgi:hypothetical protein